MNLQFNEKQQAFHRGLEPDSNGYVTVLENPTREEAMRVTSYFNRQNFVSLNEVKEYCKFKETDKRNIINNVGDDLGF